MKIQWEITKERGNLRPTLTYSFEVAPFERNLAIPPIQIVSTIPQPESPSDEFCYPGEHERAEDFCPDPARMYKLEIVAHKGRLWPQSLRLPWREDNEYPEVEESFYLLRQAFEMETARACASQPMKLVRSLNISTGGKKSSAAAVLADKFLRFAENKERGAEYGAG